MPKDLTKNINLNLEIKHADDLKKLNDRLRETNKELAAAEANYEKLRRQHKKSSPEKARLKAIRDAIGGMKALIAEEEAYHKHIVATNRAIKDRDALAKSQATQKFWAQDVWSGKGFISNIASRFNPIATTQRRLTAAQNRQQTAQNARIAASTKVVEQGELIKQLGVQENEARGVFDATRAGTKARTVAANNLTKIQEQLKAAEAARKQAMSDEARAAGAEAAAGKQAKGLTGTMILLQATKAVAGAIYRSFASAFKTVTGMSVSIKENFGDILQKVGEITGKSGMASYATGTSLFTNAAARETQLRYGLSGGAAYAFDQTRSILGIKSDEDLVYMNKSQRGAFMQIMQKQSQWYDQLQSSGVLRNIQQFQLEFEMYKQEMSVGILQWVSKHKDEVLTVINGTLAVLKGLLAVLAKLITFFGIGSPGTYGIGSTALSDSIASGARAGVTNRNVTMTANLNANGVLSSQEALQDYMERSLERIVRETYEAQG